MGARNGELVILNIIFKDFQYLQIYENMKNHISLNFHMSNLGQKTDPSQNQILSGVSFLTRIARMPWEQATAILCFLTSRKLKVLRNSDPRYWNL